jgi:hypothetical protein
LRVCACGRAQESLVAKIGCVGFIEFSQRLRQKEILSANGFEPSLADEEIGGASPEVLGELLLRKVCSHLETEVKTN